MSLFDRIRPNVPDRAVGVATVPDQDRCRACGTTVLPLHTIGLETGPELVCLDPSACRQRALLAGVWSVT